MHCRISSICVSSLWSRLRKRSCDFAYLDHTTLRVLNIEVSGSVAAFIKLANVFPMIEEFSLSLYQLHSGTFADVLLVLSHFHNLRVVHGSSIWVGLSDDEYQDSSQMPSDDDSKECYTAPVTNFALNSCADPKSMLDEDLLDGDQDAKWVGNAAVNHRIWALARRCKKLERVDAPLDNQEVVRIARKNVNWGDVKVMADWLGVGKARVDAEWQDIGYSILDRYLGYSFFPRSGEVANRRSQ
ncbi:hypothetical protein BDN72DRAFT_844379, partial [Pluteus cervinus]